MTIEQPDLPAEAITDLKPTLFIGSSKERVKIARSLKKTLSDCAEVTVWDEAGEFELGDSVLHSLIEVGEQYDFALLVFGQDDCTMMSGKMLPSVRDNVLFELGLFMGHMGRNRAFWLSPKGSKAPSFPSDLGGILHLAFDEPELTNDAAILTSLAETRLKIRQQIDTLGFRTNRTTHVVPMRRALCLASKEYSEERFQNDIKHIHDFYSTREVEAQQGVTAEDFYEYFGPGKMWDMVHLGLFVDKDNQRLLFDDAGSGGSLSVQAVEGRIKECGAQLVVIITCDSLRFGERLARFTNVIAGYKPIAPKNALSWAKIFYEGLSVGMPLSQAFDKAHDAVDPGLVLLARRDIRFRRLTSNSF